MPNSTPDNAPVKAQRILEVNAAHPVFAALQALSKDGNEEKLKQYAGLLYNQAMLIEGMPIEDPVAFSNAICDLMSH